MWVTNYKSVFNFNSLTCLLISTEILKKSLAVIFPVVSTQSLKINLKQKQGRRLRPSCLDALKSPFRGLKQRVVEAAHRSFLERYLIRK